MTRLRTLWIAPAISITALMVVAVNAFVPWAMHAVLSNPMLVALLSNLSWVIPVWLAVFMPMPFGWHRQHRSPSPDLSARLTLRRPSPL